MNDGIVLIVEKIPIRASNCPFAKWHPYPPIVEEPGYYECSLGDRCELMEKKCLHMKELGSYES